jgi:hypothetical protein
VSSRNERYTAPNVLPTDTLVYIPPFPPSLPPFLPPSFVSPPLRSASSIPTPQSSPSPTAPFPPHMPFPRRRCCCCCYCYCYCCCCSASLPSSLITYLGLAVQLEGLGSVEVDLGVHARLAHRQALLQGLPHLLGLAGLVGLACCHYILCVYVWWWWWCARER